MNRKSFDEESYKNLNIQNKEQNIPNNMIGSLFLMNNMDVQTDSSSIVHLIINLKYVIDMIDITIFFFFLENIVLGKNTEEACNCVVGLTNEVNVELINNGDRWITYIFKLIEVVGDTQSIELNIPSKEILINSNSIQSTKV